MSVLALGGPSAGSRKSPRGAAMPTAILVTMTALLLPSPAAAARPIRDVRPLPVRQVVITADDRCPRPKEGEIFVCGIRKMARADLRALHRFSRCVAGEKPAEARAILASGYRSDDSGGPLRRIASEGLKCAPVGRLSVSGILFAGAMAEALVHQRIRDHDLAALLAAASVGRPPLAARDETEVMSLCVVQEAPAEVTALFDSEAGSEREAIRLRALMPRLNACLARNLRLVTNPSGIRASLALAAWRLILDTGAEAAPMEVI